MINASWRLRYHVYPLRYGNHINNMLTVFGYSLAGLGLVLFLSRNMTRMSRLLLALLTLIIMNGPTLLALLLKGQ